MEYFLYCVGGGAYKSLPLRFSNLVFNVLQNSQDPVQEMAGKVVMDQDPALRDLGLGLGQTTGGG